MNQQLQQLKPVATIRVASYLNDATAPAISVDVTWTGAQLDRPYTGGFGLGLGHMALAQRLVRAINAGAVYENAEIRRDVNGATYVNASSKVLGRCMNADLRRLGF